MTPRTGLGWNPLAGMVIETRADMAAALCRLLAPLEAYLSPGGARVELSAAGAAFDRAAIGLEGFARRLWGGVPAAMGGFDVLDWDGLRQGLAHGCDPDHPEFWGWPGTKDQRLVEMAAVGFALLAVPERIWQPLAPEAKRLVARYLRHACAQEHSANNWMYFRLLVEAGLRQVGETVPDAGGDGYRAALEALYLGEGWYRDGPGRRVDHYTGFAFHTYALLLHRYASEPGTEEALTRARLFAPQFAAWFDAEGRGLAYGRSMTYRFGMAAFFGAYALAERDVPVLPWGVLRGLVLRHLNHWCRQPIADRDGVLSVGYGYPSPFIGEDYNSACSPYWALKAFLPLALPVDHPFWSTDGLPLPPALPEAQAAPGFLLQRLPDQTVALAAGQEAAIFRHGAEKYAKFAYSTRFPFSVEGKGATLNVAALDSALGMQGDGRSWTARRGCHSAKLSAQAVHAVWWPYDDVRVETWLVPWCGGHLRRHVITSPVSLDTVEGGFALPRDDGTADHQSLTQGSACVGNRASSQIVDLGGTRVARIHAPEANTNLGHACVWVPQLLGRIEAGTSVLLCWCAAGTSLSVLDPEAALAHLAKVTGQRHDWKTVLALTGTPDI